MSGEHAPLQPTRSLTFLTDRTLPEPGIGIRVLSQVLKLIKHSFPIDAGFYQMYADALNAAANTSTGTGAQRVAPDMQAE